MPFRDVSWLRVPTNDGIYEYLGIADLANERKLKQLSLGFIVVFAVTSWRPVQTTNNKLY